MKNNFFLILIVFFFGAMGMTSCKHAKQVAQAKYMDNTYANIKKFLPDADIVKLADTIKVILPSNVLFDFNSSDVRQDAYPSIQKLSQALNEYDKITILVAGYTDSIGTHERNRVLSRERADNVKNILVQNQVNTKRIYTWGLGAKNPITSNETEEGRQKNRRVEFILLYNYKVKGEEYNED